MSDRAVISIDKLSKRYGPTLPYALKDLTLDVHRGEVFGFLGPNGAGKSTTIRTLLNFIQPTRGSAKINGLDIVSDSVKLRKDVGYLSGDFAAYDKMTGQQFLNFMAQLQPLKRKSHLKELSSLFNANLHSRIRDLSKGNRQKIGIIQAFMHDPSVLILDEPTDGLDPLMQDAFYGLVRQRKEAGATVFASSHNLAEVQKMCDRVGIIRGGQLVSESKIEDLRHKAAQSFAVTFAHKIPLSSLRAVSGISKAKRVSDTSVTFEASGDLSPVLSFLAKQGVVSLRTEELNLATEFMKYYETDKQ